MPDFRQLGYDKTVTLYVMGTPSKYEEARYIPVILHNCQVVINHKHNTDKNGSNGADKAAVSFMGSDNRDVTITDRMLNTSFFVVGDTSGEEQCEDFVGYMKEKYPDSCYTLTSFNHESSVIEHYELGGS